MEQKNPIDLLPPRSAGLHPYYSEDEISLIDLWQVIVARKWLVLAVIAICVLAAVLVSVFMSPLYESRAVVNIGQVTGVGQLEVPGALVQRLREEYRVDDTSEGKIPPPYLSDVTLSKSGGGDIIEIKARARTAREANRFLSDVTSKLLHQHQAVYDGIRQQLQKRLAVLRNQRDQINSETGLIEKQIRALGDKNASLVATLALEKASLIGQLPELSDEINKLALNLSPVQSSPTKLIRQPTLPVQPVQPRSVLYIVLSMFGGLLLGVFSALLAEYMVNAKNQVAIAVGKKI
jgi:LPS O-antigen subunit length determinant protein (WzzB/FepE family)